LLIYSRAILRAAAVGHGAKKHAAQRQRAEQRQMGLRAESGHRRVDRTGAENQHRDVQRQNQQRQQHAAAAYAEGQRRTDRANARQSWCADQQGQGQHCQRIAGQVELDPQYRCQYHQRQTGDQPVRHDLADDDQAERLRCQRQLFQRAVAVVVGKQPRQRKHRRQQRGNPQHTGRQLAQLVRFRTDAEWEKADDDDEKEHRGNDVGLSSHRQSQVATDDRTDQF
jgi:hypothetical protein